MDRTGLTLEGLETFVQEIMKVDVGDGCRQGRLDFIASHLGQEWRQWAATDERRQEIYLVTITTNAEEDYNQFSASDIQDWIECAVDNHFELECDYDANVRRVEVVHGDRRISFGEVVSRIQTYVNQVM